MVPVAGEPFAWFVGIFRDLVVYPLLNLAWAGFDSFLLGASGEADVFGC